MSDYAEKIEKLLINVEKPARYTGGEYNTPDMNKPCSVRVCMCFPDLYEVGMSNLGIRILYHMLNDIEGVVAERCFAPWDDYAAVLKEEGIPLCSLETVKPLKEFDIIGISVQFELLYTNILYMLELSGIPFYASERGDNYPLIVGGGPCSVNPEPFAPFFDLIVIGEGEDAMKALTLLYSKYKSKGRSRSDYLKAAADIEGVYVPSLAETIEGHFVTVKNYTVKETYMRDYPNGYFPTAILLPNIEAVHDRPVLELFRGCPNGCRFCQAGFYYRPIRKRSADRVIELAKKTIEETGFDEISLASLSSGDYPELPEVVTRLSNLCNEKGVNLSLPSLRMDSFSGAMAESSRLGSLTFAPEAGTQRLRNVINKNISESDIDNTMKEAFEMGYSSVKLYFMAGLPTETYEDLDGIRKMILRIKSLYGQYGRRGRVLSIVMSAAVFVPKPLTPFQWEAHMDMEEVNRRITYLRENLRIKGVRFNWHDIDSSALETALARGDRKLAKVVELAYRAGARFDSWSEKFKFSLWVDAFKAAEIDINNYTGEISESEPLPWDFIDAYVSKNYLLKERQKSLIGETTDSCLKGCRGCSERKGDCGL